MEPDKKYRFNDPELHELAESIYKRIKKDEYQNESAVELIKRVRREITNPQGV